MATAVRTEKKLRTPAEKKVNFGRVVQVIGPVLDVEFESGHLPELYNALRIRGKTDAGVDIDVIVEVQQHIGRNQVRAVAMSSTDAVVRGMEVVIHEQRPEFPAGDEGISLAHKIRAHLHQRGRVRRSRGRLLIHVAGSKESRILARKRFAAGARCG